jgi:hypothetical protein
VWWKGLFRTRERAKRRQIAKELCGQGCIESEHLGIGFNELSWVGWWWDEEGSGKLQKKRTREHDVDRFGVLCR